MQNKDGRREETMLEDRECVSKGEGGGSER